MYQFVDRPVTSLNRGGRFMVGAMRQWVQSMRARRCPCDALAPSFAAFGLVPALPHFQMMMTVLNHRARGVMAFCSPGCSHIAEAEALLLSLLCAMKERPAEQVRATAEMLVDDCSVPNLLIAMSALGEALTRVGAFPRAPVVDAEARRRG